MRKRERMEYRLDFCGVVRSALTWHSLKARLEAAINLVDLLHCGKTNYCSTTQ